MANLVVFPVSPPGPTKWQPSVYPTRLDIQTRLDGVQMKLASCRCGAVTAECEGDPVRIDCLACQQRTGSAFAVQANYRSDQLVFAGETSTCERISGSGNRATYHFCPNCGSMVWHLNEEQPGLFAIPVGAFADPQFPAPEFSGYAHRQHRWAAILGAVEHSRLG